VELLTPSPPTLAKYGLSLAEWQVIADQQGGVCAVCRTLPASGRLVIDHAHGAGWKKMPPELRKQHVRGLVCYLDNFKFLQRGMSIVRARSIATYLEAYEERHQPDNRRGQTNDRPQEDHNLARESHPGDP